MDFSINKSAATSSAMGAHVCSSQCVVCRACEGRGVCVCVWDWEWEGKGRGGCQRLMMLWP